MILKEYLLAIPRSFYSSRQYAEVARDWNGIGLLYLAMVVLIGLIPLTVQFAIDAKHYFSFREQIIEQMPHLQIKDGILSTDAKEPYTINNPITGLPFIIIDTGNTIHGNIANSEEPAATILLRAREIEMLTGQPGGSTIPYSQLLESLKVSPKGTYNVTQDDMRNWADMLANSTSSFSVGYYLLNAMLLTASFLFRGLIYSLICLGLANTFALRLDYPACFRLAVVASTPLLICDMVSLFLARPVFANEQLVYFLLHGVYCYFAIDSVRKYTAR